jgi:hypothetical protein
LRKVALTFIEVLLSHKRENLWLTYAHRMPQRSAKLCENRRLLHG